MSHHPHYETNPHFSRIPSQTPHLTGGASTSQTPPHKPHKPLIPHKKTPQAQHKTPQPHPVAPPGILIKTRGRNRQNPIQEPPHTVIPLPLSPEEKLPPRKNPNSAKRPLLLSPEDHDHQPQQQRPPPPPQPPRIGGVYGSTLPPIPKPSPWRTAPTPSPHNRSGHNRSGPRLPPPSRETNTMTWSAAFCCAIFWVILILGGLVVLIVYLAYRPRTPYIDISAANLNAAYLDMGFLLNGDLTILANITNPSKKSSVEISDVTFNLYYYSTLISTQYIEPFKVPKKMSIFANVHLVSSQVQLQLAQSQELKRQIETGPVLLNVGVTFRARSYLGSLFRYSYRLRTHCSVSLNSPPTGAMLARRCSTKR